MTRTSLRPARQLSARRTATLHGNTAQPCTQGRKAQHASFLANGASCAHPPRALAATCSAAIAWPAAVLAATTAASTKSSDAAAQPACAALTAACAASIAASTTAPFGTTVAASGSTATTATAAARPAAHAATAHQAAARRAHRHRRHCCGLGQLGRARGLPRAARPARLRAARLRRQPPSLLPRAATLSKRAAARRLRRRRRASLHRRLHGRRHRRCRRRCGPAALHRSGAHRMRGDRRSDWLRRGTDLRARRVPTAIAQRCALALPLPLPLSLPLPPPLSPFPALASARCRGFDAKPKQNAKPAPY